MKIEFLSTLAVIAPDPPASRKLYVDALGLPLESRGDNDYHASEQIGGRKHFAVWPLSQAAEACFGTAQWPAERPVPQVSIEFDVAGCAGRERGGAGAAAGWLRAAASGARGALGSNGGEAAIARRRDHRDLVCPIAHDRD